MTVLQNEASEIRTTAQMSCPVCGNTGELVYSGLHDVLFGAPGKWQMRRCNSSDCELHWLDPRPRQEDLGKAYAHYYTHANSAVTEPPRSSLKNLAWAMYSIALDGYLQLRYGYTQGVGSRWHVLLTPIGFLFPTAFWLADHEASFLPAPRPGARLLEVGCGTGEQLERKRHLGWQAEGLDLDPDAVAVARQRGLQVAVGSLADQHYPSCTFEAINLTHVLEHVLEPRALLVEIERILTPGGLLVVETPNAKSWGHRLFRRGWRGLEPPRHVTLFTRKAIRRVCGEAGFEVLSIFTCPRIARFIWNHSVNHPESPPITKFARALPAGLAFEQLERIGVRFSADAGDELVVVARKRLAGAVSEPW
jgi:SAM-dependent methyltransferase